MEHGKLAIDVCEDREDILSSHVPQKSVKRSRLIVQQPRLSRHFVPEIQYDKNATLCVRDVAKHVQ